MIGRVVLAAVVVAGLAGCTAADPPAAAPAPAERLPAATDFRAGPCRALAEPVLGLARLAHRNAGEDELAKADRAELSRHQDELGAVDIKVEPALAPAVTSLVTAIGFVRLRVDSHSYQPVLLRDLDEARRSVQRTCVS